MGFYRDLGVALGLTGLTALTDVFTVSETAPILATMIGLAVGIDYALFIISRYRQNLADGRERDGRRGPAIAGRLGRRLRGLTVGHRPGRTAGRRTSRS